MPILCHINDLIENRSKGFNINGQLIFAVKKYEKVHVYQNSCPHLGIQLEMIPDQFLDSTHSLIMCSMHGALFRIEDGYCVSGPCLDKSLKNIPFTVKDDKVVIDI